MNHLLAVKAKVLALLVAAALVLQLAACGGSPSSSTTSSIAYLGYPPLVSQGYMTGLEETQVIISFDAYVVLVNRQINLPSSHTGNL